MKRNRTYTYILIIFASIALLFSSCRKDFEKIDTDPLGITEVSDAALFNGLLTSIIPPGNEYLYIHNEIIYPQTQLCAQSQTAWSTFSIGTESIWQNYYYSLTSVRELERRFESYGTGESVNNMKAMLKIINAYKTFRLTDYFGDIPYTQAGYGFQNFDYLHPRFDAQRDIYLSLLEDLKWANDSINENATDAEPYKSFAVSDRLFDGNLNQWRKFANSMRLRYSLRMFDKEPEIAGEIIADILENDLPVLKGMDFTTSLLESASVLPSDFGTQNWGNKWAFRENRHLRLGTTMWNQLSANDSSDGSGIFDPRAFIFFEGDAGNKWKVFPQIPETSTPLASGVPYGDHRDTEGNYAEKAGENYSPVNYFLIADVDNMPVIMMTGAEVHFIKAEIYLRGLGVAADRDKADAEYMAGLQSSIEWWTGISKQLKLHNTGIMFKNEISIPESVNFFSVQNYFGSFMAENDDQLMEFITTQRWIDSFMQPWEAFAEMRRTNSTPHIGAFSAYYRLPYPTSEELYNTENMAVAEQRQGGKTTDTKMWWMK